MHVTSGEATHHPTHALSHPHGRVGRERADAGLVAAVVSLTAIHGRGSHELPFLGISSMRFQSCFSPEHLISVKDLVVPLRGKTGSEAREKRGGDLAYRDVKSSTNTGSQEISSLIVIFDDLEAASIA